MSRFFRGTDVPFLRRAEQARKDTKTGARKGIRLALLNTLGVSNEHVPHEDGDLERDGGVSLEDQRLRGAISYGRNAETRKYAVVQHEDLTLRHDPGRNAKFLENALNSTRDQNAKIVQQAVKKEVGT